MEARIPPAPRDELGPLAALIAWAAGIVTGGEPPRIFTTLGLHRRLFRAWLPFAGTLLFRTRLPRVDVELVVLRTASNCSSPYEWTQHVTLARRAGLSSKEIEAVACWPSGTSTATLSPRQRALLAASDQLHERKAVTDSTWKELVDLLDERELIELCMVVGHYEMVAMTLNSLGVQPEPSARAGLDSAARDTADALEARLSRLRAGGVSTV